MNINLTLIGQMITFLVFVIFTMKYVWPPMTKALRERQKRIAEGLADADRGKHELELAQHKSMEILRDAKLQAAKLIEDANIRALHLVEESKEQAREESARILKHAQEEIVIERSQARESLRQEIAGLAVMAAGKVLDNEVNEASNSAILDKLIAEVASE
ncbi:MAG: F0F1 ATP synthase subunit B [Legionellales bacterium]|nr:F0F1 ATP synthase subunit B [Legionellales bacterium]